MDDRFSTTVTINATPSEVWNVLTNPSEMTRWMGEDLQLEIITDWQLHAPIVIKGFHHAHFKNKGVILQFEEGRRLSYSHLSDISRLPDTPENYCILDYQLTSVEGQTQLTFEITNFPTEVIRKHLEFYWRTTIVKIKNLFC